MNTINRLLLLGTFTLFTFQFGLAQDTIWLKNPSFENQPRNSIPPDNWIDCGYYNETPPDVQPGGGFEVWRPAQHGKTYLGMVCRDNSTNEMVSQKLPIPLIPGHCYKISLWACRSSEYLSFSRLHNREANYTEPISLEVYLGYELCREDFLVGNTQPVTTTDWTQYTFEFVPDDEYQFLKLKAGDMLQLKSEINGNVLIDNLSHIIEISCVD